MRKRCHPKDIYRIKSLGEEFLAAFDNINENVTWKQTEKNKNENVKYIVFVLVLFNLY